MGDLYKHHPMKKPTEPRPIAPVRWLVTDGVRPNRQSPGYVFNLKSPFPLTIPPGSSARIQLGVSCNYPLHVFQARGLLQRRLTMPDGIWAAQDAEQDLVIELRNEGNEVQYLERGDVLARAFVMENIRVWEEE